MAELYSSQEMIRAVCDYLQTKDYNLCTPYDPVFDPARVPVFGYKKSKDDQEVFVDIITEKTIVASDYFRKKIFTRSLTPLRIKTASSAEFYKHYFPNAYIYWAVPDYIEKNKEFDTFVQNCRSIGVGIFEIGKKKKFIVTELHPAEHSLRSSRLNTISSIIESEIGNKLSDKLRKRMSKELSNFSKQDLSYLVYYPEPMYLAPDVSTKDEERRISPELVNRMAELENISYKKTLIDFAKTYYSENKDDYTIALRVTKRIWDLYDLEYPDLHKDFEDVLKLDPRYRDHFLHAFQVFLYGAYIIDKKYSRLKESGFANKNGGRIEDAWAIAATYHDYNYMIQQFDTWTKKFFIRALHLDEGEENPAALELDRPYVKSGYMHHTKKLTDFLKIDVNKEVLNFLYRQILEEKNHGLISGLSLLKYLERNANKLTDKVRNAACKAISIHDLNLLKELDEIVKKHKPTQKKRGNKATSKNFSSILFERDPISFLLILADCVQEQGRGSTGNNTALLQKFYYEGGSVFSEIQFIGKDSKNNYEKKKDELKLMKKYLSSGGSFSIYISTVVENEAGESEHSTANYMI